jgi:hypothetical protein
MKISSALLLTLISWLWSAPNLATGPQKMAETVTIHFVNHFGVPWQDCHVEEFASTIGDDGSDYASRFHGLTARNIPFNRSYRLVLECTKVGYPSFPFYVDVLRDRTFIVVSSWLHRGDYQTGLGPRLTVSLARPQSERAAQAWVKVVGVYIDYLHSEGVDQQSGEAGFDWIVPGTYMVLLLTPEKLVCAKQIDLLEPHGRLELDPTPNGCTAKALALVKVIE